MKTTYTRKIGLNRGKARLWLEGAILSANGFYHGALWGVAKRDENGSPVLDLVAGQLGDRQIAGMPHRPIVDINSAKLLEGFTPGETVTITVMGEGWLIVRKEG